MPCAARLGNVEDAAGGHAELLRQVRLQAARAAAPPDRLQHRQVDVAEAVSARLLV
jgi:hypothetical protein